MPSADLFTFYDDLYEKIPCSDIERALCRQCLYEFVIQAWPIVEPGTEFIPGFHIETICDHLEAVYRGEIRRLIINIPPRFSKSTIVSLLWPVWCWLQNPSTKFLFASYAEDLALRDATRARNLIYSPWFQARWGDEFLFLDDMNTKGRYVNTRGGSRFSTGVDAQMTGEGGDILVGDDLHNVIEALSKASRETVKLWWSEVAVSRFNNLNTGRAVMIGQRVHEDDLSAYLIKGGLWTLLCLPNEWSEETHCVTPIFEDPRKPGVVSPYRNIYPDIEQGEGALLCPARMGREQSIAQKKEMGGVGYGAQYNQNPVNRGGEFFKVNHFGRFSRRGDYFRLCKPGEAWDKAVVYHLQDLRLFITADTASTAKTHSDFTAIGVWGMTPDGKLLWLDLDHDQIEIPQVRKRIRAMATKWHTKLVVIEYAASGIGLVQDLRDDPTLLVRGISPVTDAELKAGVTVRIGDKISRATMGQIKLEAEQVYVPDTSDPWIDTAFTELRSFTCEMTHAHDDIVDAFAYAVMEVLTGFVSNATGTLPEGFKVEGMGQGFATR